jgi:hypothetical protein
MSRPEETGMDYKHGAQAAEVLAAYKKYLEAFMSSDMNGINALVLSGIDSTVLDVERRRRPELGTALRTVVVLV